MAWTGKIGYWEKKQASPQTLLQQNRGSLEVSTRAGDWKSEKRVLALRNDAVDCARTGRLKIESAKGRRNWREIWKAKRQKMKKNEKEKRNRDPGNGNAKKHKAR